MPYYPEKELVEPSFPSAEAAIQAIRDFTEKHTRHEAVTQISLGYGPLGAYDPNYAPVFRRRYYMTKERLQVAFDKAYKTDCVFLESKGADPDARENLDNFLLDVRWFLKNRTDMKNHWKDKKEAK